MKSRNQLIDVIFNDTFIKPSELDGLCWAVREEKTLNNPHPETGATLLGLAITLLRPNIVKSLLKAGARINQTVGLKGKENYLPLTLIMGKQHPSSIQNLFLSPSNIINDETTHIEPCDCTDKREEILYLLFQHPLLNTQKSGKLKSPHYLERIFLTNKKYSSIQPWFTHHAQFGYIDKYTHFSRSLNEEKKFDGRPNTEHTADLHLKRNYKNPEITWLIKAYNKKSFLNHKNLIIEDKKFDMNLEKVHSLFKKKSVEDSSREKNYIFFANSQWWACGQFPKGDVHISTLPADLAIPQYEHTKIAMLAEIQDRFNHLRCRREVLAMEWHRLFNNKQPRYKLHIDQESNHRVAVEYLDQAQDIRSYLKSTTEPPTFSRFAENLVDILITHDADPKMNNFLIVDNTSIHIDGDKCFFQLFSQNENECFSPEIPIKKLLEEQSLYHAPYFYWNFLDFTFQQTLQTQHPHTDALTRLVKTPQFKQELHVAILKRICMPINLIQTFVNHYISNPFELEQLQDIFTSRINIIKNAALKNLAFRHYLLSEKAEHDLEIHINTLKQFDITPSYLLFSNEKEDFINQIHLQKKQLMRAFSSAIKFEEKIKPSSPMNLKNATYTLSRKTSLYHHIKNKLKLTYVKKNPRQVMSIVFISAIFIMAYLFTAKTLLGGGSITGTLVIASIGAITGGVLNMILGKTSAAIPKQSSSFILPDDEKHNHSRYTNNQVISRLKKSPVITNSLHKAPIHFDVEKLPPKMSIHQSFLITRREPSQEVTQKVGNYKRY
jgi:hypothetical protein